MLESPAKGLVVAALGVGLFTSAASARVYGWNFIVDPNAPSNQVPMTAIARGALWDGGTANGTPYGGAVPGTGLQGDGTAVFAESPAENACSGFVIGGWDVFTLDVRVRVLEDVIQGAGRSMSIVDSTEMGRGVKLRPGGIELVNGSGVVGSYEPIDMTQWQVIRFSLSGNGTVDTYLWDSSWNGWNGEEGGSPWIALGSQGLGGSGWNVSPALPAGVALGSMAGSSTQSGKFQIDWAYVDDARARGDDRWYWIPEPTASMLLVLGTLPLLWRRAR
jgi:hypothetical protein